jgi:CBS domain containing-hemolysin-like protein
VTRTDSDNTNNGSSVEPETPSESSRRGGSSQGWLAALRQRLGLAGPLNLRETLEEALKATDKAESMFSPAERDMLGRLLRFGALRVEDIMVPRADIIAIDESASISELLQRFVDAGVSRIPIFRETLDDPRGMVHIKDLVQHLMTMAAAPPASGASIPLQPVERRGGNGTGPQVDLNRVDLNQPISLARLRRPMLYVPPSMPAMNLLIRMQTTRIHMALVVDEYGGTDGMVTIEDLVEQVVGEIEDEHDVAEDANIVEDPKLGLIARARTPIQELEAKLGVKLVDEEAAAEIDTLAGLVYSIVGRVPARGEIVAHPSRIEFEVLDADPRRIKTVKIHVNREEAAVTPPESPVSEVAGSGEPKASGPAPAP